MNIQASFGVFRSYVTGALSGTRLQPSTPAANPFQAVNQALRGSDMASQLSAQWGGLLAGPSLTAPLELQRNSETRVGLQRVQVDPQGSMRISGPQLQFAMAGQGSCGSFAAAGSLGMGPAQIKNGVATLPNGEQIKVDTNGVVLVYPDGTQFGAGRNSPDSPEQIRQVTAGPGQQIPTSPPGQTTYLFLGPDGSLIGKERR